MKKQYFREIFKICYTNDLRTVLNLLRNIISFLHGNYITEAYLWVRGINLFLQNNSYQSSIRPVVTNNDYKSFKLEYSSRKLLLFETSTALL